MSDAGEKQFKHHADVSAQRIARVYAEALLGAAEKKHQDDEVAEQLESLVEDLFKADPQFEEFLASGAIGRHHKADALRSIFGKRASELFFHFLMVLNEHERLGLLRSILHAYRELRDQRARRLRVQVRSAVALEENQRQRLQQELQETFHLEPVLEAQVDPDLIGGMIVRVGDWLYDASLRTQLENIRTQMIARSSHEIQSGRNRFSSASGN